LDHPDQLAVVTEVDEGNGEDDEDSDEPAEITDDVADSNEDELQQRSTK
jgi:hypothetical protein